MLYFRILYTNVFCFVLVVLCVGCGVKQKDESLSLGRLHALQILPNTLPHKPQKEIVRICVSFMPFNAAKQYKILTFENLLRQAYKATQQKVFTKVGIWQQSINILVWQKKCLILGE